MKYFTIKDFSKSTGLPPSKLRFYDKKELLQPSTRLNNGYRVYTVDQIHLAKMIDSLRQADIAIEEIKRYIEGNEQEKVEILVSWKKELDKKMEVLLAAKKYVGGIQVESSHSLLLSKWEKEKYFVWQRFEAEKRPHPFQKFFQQAVERLESQGIYCSEQVYVKTEKITNNKIIGEIGFEIDPSIHIVENTNIRFERISPTLFAVLRDCRADDEYLCFSYIQMVIRYGFQPVGNKLERYSNIYADRFDYLLPLVK
ncbi:MerR family transcriptional regulator [Robertmurraya korlensis]|uniref:MerR family transcriptional regulator n=1 Tax=Robertmurraya korlensis TaxID=519977 RepID=UPI0008257E06|nr:MerR family transcriptional regulator [Robertmurraya korlensis]